LQRVSDLRLKAAVQALRAEGVVACPTESVWGLSCDPDSEQAVFRVLQLKQRPVARGLILVAASESQLGFLLCDLSAEERERLSASWPGPSTWLIPHRYRLQPWVYGEHDTVAVRVSDHPVVQQLCRAWGGPLISTSANPAGAQPARSSFAVQRYFGTEVDERLPGHVGAQPRPSQIRDLVTGEVLRA
jgi:L-threonylcarbamoyladenylate synthase